MRTVFTTGQAAKICKVAPRTVTKWFDSGRIKGFRIPGSQDRRIPRESLIRFLKEHGMPLGELEDEGTAKVLLVGADSAAYTNLSAGLAGVSFKLEIAIDAFDAGMQVEFYQPDAVVIDFSIGHSQALLIAQNLRLIDVYVDLALIALVSDEDVTSGFDRTNFNETFRKPYDNALLAERIRTLVSRKKQLA